MYIYIWGYFKNSNLNYSALILVCIRVLFWKQWVSGNFVSAADTKQPITCSMVGLSVTGEEGA